MSKKIIIYCRVATMSEAHEISSIANQRLACFNFAKRNGYQVNETVEEMGSGLKINKKLRRILKEVASGKIKTIIAVNPDRISRDSLTFIKTLKKIEKHDVNLRFITHPYSSIDSLISTARFFA